MIDLDSCYEMTPKRHILESYTEKAFPEGDRDFDKSLALYPSDADEGVVNSRLDADGLNNTNTLDRCVVAHCAVTWRNRTWPREFWETTLKDLTRRGWKVLTIGKDRDFEFQGPGFYNYKNHFSIQQLSYLISCVGCFVANDSGMIHVAGTTQTRIVGLFTSAKGEYRVPWRQGEYGHNTTIVKPDIACYGCLHEYKPPVYFADCKFSSFECLGKITPKMVVEAVDAG